MRLVFALAGNNRALSVMDEFRPRNILVSYAYRSMLARFPRSDYLIIDSGAFSAWNSGREILLADYARFVAEVYRKYPRAVFVNLDVIPGERGRDSTASERSVGMRRSLAHADSLRGMGVRLMEVFHQDEPMTFLNLLLRRMQPADILGLSPRNDVAPRKRVEWLKMVLAQLLTTRSPSQLPRCHGLAVTGREAMQAFPFYSVDSSTWYSPFTFGRCVAEGGRTFKVDEELPSSFPVAVQKVMGHRTLRNMVKLEEDTTALWAKRGVVWTDP